VSYGSIAQARWFEAANDVAVSKHAFKRSNQRGLQLKGLNLVLEFGESVDDGFVMTQSALKQAAKILQQQKRRQDIQRLGHLSNVVVILEGGVMATTYRADKKRIQRLRAGHVDAA
jgi:hypothetical protein